MLPMNPSFFVSLKFGIRALRCDDLTLIRERSRIPDLSEAQPSHAHR